MAVRLPAWLAVARQVSRTTNLVLTAGAENPFNHQGRHFGSQPISSASTSTLPLAESPRLLHLSPPCKTVDPFFGPYGSPDDIICKDPLAAWRMQKAIEELANSAEIVVFGKPNCQFTEKAVNCLILGGCRSYKIINVAENPEEMPLVLAVLSMMTGKKPTVAKVFIDGKFIGGGNQMARLWDSGEVMNIIPDRHFSKFDSIKSKPVVKED